MYHLIQSVSLLARLHCEVLEASAWISGRASAGNGFAQRGRYVTVDVFASRWQKSLLTIPTNTSGIGGPGALSCGAQRTDKLHK